MSLSTTTLAPLQTLYAQAQAYLADCQSGAQNDPNHDVDVQPLTDALNALNFDDVSGTGYQVVNGQQDFSVWASQFKTACDNIETYRAQWLFGDSGGTDASGNPLPNTHSVFQFNFNTVAIGSSVDITDPMVGWYDNIVTPSLVKLMVAGIVSKVGDQAQPLEAPLKALGDGIAGISNTIILVLCIIAFILVLWIVSKVV